MRVDHGDGVVHSAGWSVRHAAAVATGALLSRGVMAFFYYPVIGDTTAVQKYTHNVVMLAIVGVTAWLALRKHQPDQANHPRVPAGNRQAARTAWQQALTILDELDHLNADQLRVKLGRPPERRGSKR